MGYTTSRMVYIRSFVAVFYHSFQGCLLNTANYHLDLKQRSNKKATTPACVIRGNISDKNTNYYRLFSACFINFQVCMESLQYISYLCFDRKKRKFI